MTKVFTSENVVYLWNKIKATFLGKNDTAVAAKKLETARNINGVSFDGTKDISIGTDDKVYLTLAEYKALQASGQIDESKMYVTTDEDDNITPEQIEEWNNKVDPGDIVDNLTSEDATLPLSANQGRVLNEGISQLNSDLETKQNKGWALLKSWFPSEDPTPYTIPSQYSDAIVHVWISNNVNRILQMSVPVGAMPIDGTISLSNILVNGNADWQWMATLKLTNHGRTIQLAHAYNFNTNVTADTSIYLYAR